MKTITNINFLSLEFDFGYNKENEESYENKGRIDAEVFVQIDDAGQKSQIQHHLQLQDISFSDFMNQEDKEKLTVGDGFSSLIQSLRLAITYKVASDLNMELVDVDFAPVEPLRSKVESLENRTQSTEQALVQIMMEGVL